MKSQKEAADRLALVKTNQLIGQLKLKIISMNNTVFPRHSRVPIKAEQPHSEEHSIIILPRTGVKMSPLNLNSILVIEDQEAEKSSERKTIKQNVLLNAFMESEIR